MLDGKVLLAKIEQQNLEWATVVLVDDSSTDINRVLGCKARSGRNSAV